MRPSLAFVAAITTCVVLTSSAAAQGGDDCSVPDPIAGLGSFGYDTTSATTSGFEGGNNLVCGSVYGVLEADAFFVWTATTPGNVQVTNCGGASDTILNAHFGSDCSATCVVSSDTPCCDTGTHLLIPAVGTGDVYLIQVAQWTWSSPGHAGTLVFEVPPIPPGNDTCSSPSAISGTGGFAYDLRGATTSNFDGNDPILCGLALLGEPARADVFFVWTAVSAGDYVFDTCGVGCDTVLNLHQGSDCTATCIDANDDGPCGLQGESRLALTGVAAGDEFLIQAGQWISTFGNHAGTLNINLTTTLPTHDDCFTARVISGPGAFAIDTTNATTSLYGDPGQVGPCFVGEMASDVFFQWTAVTGGDVQFRLSGTTVNDTVLRLHAGAGCGSTCVASDEDSGSGLDARLQVSGVQPGDTFLVQCGSALATDVGLATLEIGPWAPPPAHNTCSAPLVIAGFGSFAFDNLDATTSSFMGSNPDALCSATAPGTTGVARDLFFTWTAPCTGTAVLHTCNSDYIASVSVYAGDDCGATCLEGSDSVAISCAAPNPAEVVFSTNQGMPFLLQVGAWSENSGEESFDIVIAQLGPTCTAGTITPGCGPGNPHHLGASATLLTSFFGSGSGSGLRLECTNGPAGEFAFFMISPSANASLNVFNGVLCLDAPQGRYNPNVATNMNAPQLNSLGVFDGSGVFTNLVGTSASGRGFDVPSELPLTPPGQVIAPGDTWHFQCWYRDQVAPLPNPGSSANFSDAIEVTF
tara:strand:+ start:3080 stop:5338 length:2259 start_codon:yes stop_codon:yes gene_type:complete